MDQRSLGAGLDYRVSPDVTLQVGGGVGLFGRLVVDGAHHEMLPGWLATVSGSWRVVDGAGSKPFVIVGATLGASRARTRALGAPFAVAYTAFDMRLGATVGKTYFEVLSPYAAARVFGGPILWRFRGEDRTGTDQYHVQIAAGLTVALPGHVDVFAEGAPLGERAATVGVGAAF